MSMMPAPHGENSSHFDTEKSRKWGFQPGHEYMGGNKPGVVLPSMQKEAIKQRQLEVIRYLVEGATLKEVAKVMGLHIATVSSYLKDPWVREQLRQLHAGMVENLDMQILKSLRTKAEAMDECAELALKRMKEILENDNAHPAIMAKMIDSALDRTPELSRTRKLDVTERKLIFSGQDLLEAVSVMSEIENRERTRTVSVEPQESSK